MEWSKSFLMLLLFLQLHNSDTNPLTNSIIAMINEFYTQHTTLNLIVQFNDSSLAVLAEKILPDCTNLSLTIESIDCVREIGWKRRNVLIFMTNFELFYESLTRMNFAFDGFYTIVTPRITNVAATSVFAYLWKSFIYNVNIMTVHDDEVILETFLPFQETSCHETNPIVINKFLRDKQIWHDREFFPYKLNNFHKCTVRAGTFEYAPAVIKEKEELHGSDMELVWGLEDILNFHLNLTFSDKPGASGMTYDNGTVTGLKTSLLNDELDLLFGLYYATYPNCKYMGCSQPYYAVTFNIIVPQRSLTSLQKFFVPFKLDVWITLSTLLLTAVVIIAIVEYKMKTARNFIIGEQIRSPYIEMVTAFIGNSTLHLPRRNFARYLLMTFILFSLVMRTVYTGGLFKFLQSDAKVTPIESVSDLIASKYKIYAMFYFVPYLRNMGLASSTIQIKPEEEEKYKRKTLDPDFRGGFMITSDELLYLNKINANQFTYRVCKEHLYTVNNGLLFQQNSYLIETFNRVISHLQSNGLIHYWISKYIDTKYYNVKEPGKQPRRLTINQLYGSFQMLFFGLFASTICFIVEVFYKKFRRRKIQFTARDLVYVVILSAAFRSKESSRNVNEKVSSEKIVL